MIWWIPTILLWLAAMVGAVGYLCRRRFPKHALLLRRAARFCAAGALLCFLWWGVGRPAGLLDLLMG